MADIKVKVGQQNAIKVVSSLAGNVSGSLSGLDDDVFDSAREIGPGPEALSPIPAGLYAPK